MSCNSKTTKIQTGIITISYKFTLDGETSQGYNEYNCIVTQYWSKNNSQYANLPKEVKILSKFGYDEYYRQTTKNGWRKYNKLRSPKYENNCYTGKIIKFVPNIKENIENNYNNIFLGK